MNRITQFCTLLSMAALLTNCHSSSDANQEPPAAVITRKVSLPTIPSASGIEKVNDRYYIIGDDSPYLFCLNEAFEVTQKILLLDSDAVVNGRIPKPVKPDLEAMTQVNLEGDPYLLIMGSGSMSTRNTAYLIPITPKGAGKPKSVSLVELYGKLSADKNIIGQATLNIEGLGADEEYLYLLQRYAPGGQNVLITYTISSIESFLLGKAPGPKPTTVQAWALPDIARIKTGFSGVAPALGGKLLFTASAEETPNAVLDGEVYGSMVGWLLAHPHPSAKPATPEVVVPITEKGGGAYKSKIESICITNQHRHNLTAVAVADNDDGFSELIVLEFNW
ncbi:DUF6929 family protein [Rufibacter radiotolerans]|uniref:DUF6929 family protein n=1 Tax=Rufibacter radiotolerans TaxID=1379910 RepID=UPI0018CD6786|nr:hypothetical protein [Rufibacter radiotolerans]